MSARLVFRIAALARLRGATRRLALCFAAITVVSWQRLFLVPPRAPGS